MQYCLWKKCMGLLLLEPGSSKITQYFASNLADLLQYLFFFSLYLKQKSMNTALNSCVFSSLFLYEFIPSYFPPISAYCLHCHSSSFCLFASVPPAQHHRATDKALKESSRFAKGCPFRWRTLTRLGAELKPLHQFVSCCKQK